ncbi:MAG TPA: Ig-like domain-containing protein, partial [Candidatus Thermoplasmatota archaeon]|nr:Ig-like domain-containing protein [Candidatus Thermoplasmatota archaeon]
MVIVVRSYLFLAAALAVLAFLAAAPPAQAVPAPGPDNFGYQVEAIPFEWEDVRTGSQVRKLTECGGYELYYYYRELVEIPFPFRFYGNTHTSLWVHEEGLVTFGPMPGGWSCSATGHYGGPFHTRPTPIPTTGTGTLQVADPNNFIAAFWANLGTWNIGNDQTWYNYDLSPDFNDIYVGVFGEAPYREFVIQWTAMDYATTSAWGYNSGWYYDSDAATFQLRLEECSSSFKVYIERAHHPERGVIGFEDPTGTDGIEIWNEGPFPKVEKLAFRASQNDCPHAEPDTFVLPEDAPATVLDVLANDHDPDGDALSIRSFTQPRHGTLSLQGGKLVYQPFPDVNEANAGGPDSFTYVVRDATGLTATTTATVHLQPVNDPPSYRTATLVYGVEDSGPVGQPGVAYDIKVGRTADELQTQSLSFLIGYDERALASASMGMDGVLHYEPKPDFHGDVRLSVAGRDDGGTAHGGDDTGATRIVTLRIQPRNDAPTFLGGPSVSFLEDERPGPQSQPWATGMSAGPADEANQALSFEVEGADEGLFLSRPWIGLDGRLHYEVRPDGCTPQPLHLSVVLRDDGGIARGGADRSHPAPLVFTVACVNDPPAPAPDTGSVVRPEAVRFDVLANDRDVDGDQLTILATDKAAAAVIEGGRAILYTPDATFSGLDRVRYTVTDGMATAQGELRVSVECPGVRAQPKAYQLAEDTLLEVPAPGFRLGDSAVGPLGSVRVVEPPEGSLTARPDGSFSYRPPQDFSGTTSFLYELHDGVSCRSFALVTLEVQEANDPPVAVDDAFQTLEDLPIDPVPVLRNDHAGVDVGEPFEVTAVWGGRIGEATLRDGRIRYAPYPDRHGSDEVGYEIRDPGGLAARAVVRIEVLPVADPPRPQADMYRVSTGQPASFGAPVGVLANDADPDGAGMVATVHEPPRRGSLTLRGDGSFTYTPDAGFRGADRFLYVATDGRGLASEPAEVLLEVGGDRPPSAAFAFPDGVLLAGTPVQFTDRSVDPEDDLRAWAWDFGDGQQSTDRHPVHAFGRAGAFRVTLTVTDGEGLRATATRQVHVSAGAAGGAEAAAAAADGPRVDAGPDHSVAAGSLVRLAATGSGVLLWAWSQESGPTVEFDDPHVPDAAFLAPSLPEGQLAQDIHLLLQGWDGQLRVASDRVTVRVLAPGAPPPVLDAGADRTVRPGEQVRLAAATADLGGAAVTWRQVSGPFVLLQPVDEGAEAGGAAVLLTVPDLPGHELVLRVESVGAASVADDVRLRIVPAQGFTVERVRDTERTYIFRAAVPGAQAWDFGDGSHDARQD